MVFPTIKNLEVLARFDSADALLEWASTHEVRPVQPRVEGHGETARIVLDDASDRRRHRRRRASSGAAFLRAPAARRRGQARARDGAPPVRPDRDDR